MWKRKTRVLVGTSLLMGCGPKPNVSLTSQWASLHATSSLRPVGPAFTSDGQRLWAEASALRTPTASIPFAAARYPLGGGGSLAWMGERTLAQALELCLQVGDTPTCAPSPWQDLVDGASWGLRVSPLQGTQTVWREGQLFVAPVQAVQWADGRWSEVTLPKLRLGDQILPVAGGLLALGAGTLRHFELHEGVWTERNYKIDTIDVSPGTLAFHRGTAAWVRGTSDGTLLMRLDLATRAVHETTLSLPPGTATGLHLTDERWAVVRSDGVWLGAGGTTDLVLPALFKSTVQAVGDEIWLGIGEGLLSYDKPKSLTASSHTPGRMVWPAKVAPEVADCESPTLTWSQGEVRWFATPTATGFSISSERCPNPEGTPPTPTITECDGTWLEVGTKVSACVLHQQVSHPSDWETWIQLARRR